MAIRLLSVFILVLLAIIACRSSSAEPDPHIRPGLWLLEFDLSSSGRDVIIPITMLVDSSGGIAIQNSVEVIALDSLQWRDRSLKAKFPFFQTYLLAEFLSDTSAAGVFRDPTRSADYAIPFTGSWKQAGQTDAGALVERRIYDATFSSRDTAASHKAVGVFEFLERRVQGTFLTETGDYRYLSGNRTGDSLWLSCLDGSHLFYFTGTLRGDSMVDGQFFSGIHWTEPWEAVLNASAELRDPDSLTFIRPGSGSFRFSAVRQDGQEVEFAQNELKDRVSIIQIFGSWCPNCSDESLFLKGMYERHGKRGLQIIPVAFERSDETQESLAVIRGQAADLELPYPVYLGGVKGSADRVFPMLNQVMAYPTTIILDKRGEVRKIHTGFYGPGTGVYHTRYAERLELFIIQLLSEK
ncbi:MAG: TlpA disulfide reductase family protein [Flavobacteriales bacterium]